MKCSRTMTATIVALVLLASASFGNNGHMLHGVGAINSALGGAGVATANDAFDALSTNPALLVDLDGLQVEISAEQLTAHNAVSSEVQTPAGLFAGRTKEAGDPSIVPAMGWTLHREGSKLAVGMGILGLAGVGVDYPQDSGNPLLAPQPQGFGRVYSSYQYVRIPTAVGYRVSPRLALGGALFVGRASFAASPAGFAAPDCSGSSTCFYPTANGDSAMSYGAQLGATYRVSDRLRLGASYSTPEHTQSFEFRSAVANPGLATYGQARILRFKLQNPAVATLGVGLSLSPRLGIGLDVRRLFYARTAGFGDTQGWRDVNAVAVGLQFAPRPGWTLRAGFNHCNSPIDSRVSFLNVAAPAVFENHVSIGLGVHVDPRVEVNLAFYHAFKNSVTGSFLGPAGAVPGTRVTNEMALDSMLLTFSFRQ